MVRFLLPSVSVLIAGFLILLLGRNSGPQVGKTYLRPAHDSVVVQRAVFSDSAASPLARVLVTRMLTQPLKIKVEQSGRCSTVQAHYERVNAQLQASESPLEQAFRAARPVALFDSTDRRCFAYTVTYQLPLSRAVQYRRQALTELPLRLTLIHPKDDFELFHRVNEE